VSQRNKNNTKKTRLDK